jgi:lactoylglutathione lyase
LECGLQGDSKTMSIHPQNFSNAQVKTELPFGTAYIIQIELNYEFNDSETYTMKYLHTMVRVTDLDASIDFYCNKLGLTLLRKNEYPNGRFTLAFLAAPDDETAQVELTYNWDQETYTSGRNFGHLAYAVDNIYDLCAKMHSMGVTINRPPRDGRMAFVRSPDDISIELLQRGEPLPPQEPWLSMPNTGKW